MHMNNHYYITTPIYYITAKPHLGNLYATLLADVLARFAKLQGKQVFFITGTDEHGQKIAQAAAQAEMAPQHFVDSLVPAYQSVWASYGIDYDFFMRTTMSFHKKGAQDIVRKLMASDAIYKSHYNGWYCTPCETFVTENGGDANQMPLCGSCARETKYVSEQSYFFRLSAYADRLLNFYAQHPDFIIPRERAQEVISFVRGGLKDLSISRTTVAWGIPFPDDHEHTIYVWVEALCNYITAVGYGQDATRFATWWPAQVHVLGKDIIKFHAVYWPALLMAAQLPLPKQLLVHGWIQINKQKMSKSLGNAVNPSELCAQYGADVVRYYLLRAIPVNQDGEFSLIDLEQRLASDLANDLGNLLQRMVVLAHKHTTATLIAPMVWSDKALMLRSAASDMIEQVVAYMQDGMFHLALARVWEYIAQLNGYFHEHEPWKLARIDHARFIEVLSATAHGLYVVAHVLTPFMPTKMAQLLMSLGAKEVRMPVTLDDLLSSTWHYTFVLTVMPVLFVKPEIIAPVPQEPLVSTKQAVTAAEVNVVSDDIPAISIDTFAQVALVVGTVIEAQEMPKSDKLLILQVDFGALGNRQILSGIKKWYSPADIVGKQAIFVHNLQPRTMMGMTSQGMLLMAKDAQGNLAMATVAHPVPNGTRLS